MSHHINLKLTNFQLFTILLQPHNNGLSYNLVSQTNINILIYNIKI